MSHRAPTAGQRDPRQQFGDQALAVPTLGGRFVTGQHAVAQHVRRNRAHVVGGDEIAAGEPGVRAGAALQRDRAARARTPGDATAEVGVIARGFARGEHQLHKVTFDLRSDMQVQHCRARGEHFVQRHARRYPRGRHRLAGALAGQAQDFGLHGGLRIADAHVHQEAVELRFGQRERTFLFDRVLRGHHQEQVGQRIGLPAHGDLAFAHRLEQCGLHFRRRAVDLVGQQHLVEDRAGLEFEVAILRAPHVASGQVRRQQVRGELHACEAGIQARGQRAYRGGLGQARRALDQQVAVGQQRDQQALDELVLAHDFRAQCRAQFVEGGVQPAAAVVVGFHGATAVVGARRARVDFDPMRTVWFIPDATKGPLAPSSCCICRCLRRVSAGSGSRRGSRAGSP